MSDRAPGPKLDAEVAAEVMGLDVTQHDPQFVVGGGYQCTKCFRHSDYESGDAVTGLCALPYSTEFRFAWGVLDKIPALLRGTEHISFNLHADGSGGVSLEVYNEYRKCWGVVGDDYAWADQKEMSHWFCLGVCEIALGAIARRSAANETDREPSSAAFPFHAGWETR